ncbi:MAG: alpha/beta fold hydrolase [Clostridia bacterium]|nr:alpha/beta fold hydrolase [Clostridia bacterium]
MLYLIVIFGITALFFLFLFILYYTAFHNSPARQRHHKNSLSIDEKYIPVINKLKSDLRAAAFEEKRINSRDGKSLYARYYHNRDGVPVVIILHGYRSRGISDCGGGYRIFSELGYNILIPDHRAHGKSGSRTITFGIKERYDCLDWIEYLNREYACPDIFIVGVSMGGATALMTAGHNLPENVKGVISDCAYSSPEAIIRKVIGDMKLPHRILFPFVRLAGRIYGDFDVCSYDALKAVREAKIPVLLIHGEGDDFVPYAMAEELSAAGGCKLLSVREATHGMSYVYNAENYTKITTEFIKKCL